LKVVAIIPSAGKGERMGFKKKPFITLLGHPLLYYAIAAFEASHSIDGIVLVVPPGDEGRVNDEVIVPYRFRKIIDIIPGGLERQDSVRLAVNNIKDVCEVVIIHDGARPFLGVELIERVLSAVDITGGAIAALPVTDTIKDVSSGIVNKTISRECLWAVQTPQAFRMDILREAHNRALTDGFYGTDDAALVERLGGKVAVVDGSVENIKVTTPGDIIIGEALWKSRDRNLCV